MWIEGWRRRALSDAPYPLNSPATQACRFNGRAEPDFVAFAVEETADVKIVEGLDRVGDGDLAGAKSFLCFRGANGGESNSRVRRLCGRSVPVWLQHEDGFTQEIPDLLLAFVGWGQAKGLAVETVGAFEVFHSEGDDFYAKEAEGRSRHEVYIAQTAN